MPLRSSTSSVLKWPDRRAVDRAVREIAAVFSVQRPELVRFGYFGSYARGDWGVGSDVDLVAIVRASEWPFIERARHFDTSRLPVPADILIYTEAEWEALLEQGSRFADQVRRETVWVFPANEGSD